MYSATETRDWQGEDVYSKIYGVRKENKQALLDYYVNPNGEAVKQLDRRIAHILRHQNKLMGSRRYSRGRFHD